MANLYKLVFIGEEQEGSIQVGVGSPAKEVGPFKQVRSIYQTYLWAETSADAIDEVKSQCEQAEIKIEDFTKVSLVVSAQAIDNFMRERL